MSSALSKQGVPYCLLYLRASDDCSQPRGMLGPDGVFRTLRASSTPLPLSPFDAAVSRAEVEPGRGGNSGGGCGGSAAAHALISMKRHSFDGAARPMSAERSFCADGPGSVGGSSTGALEIFHPKFQRTQFPVAWQNHNNTSSCCTCCVFFILRAKTPGDGQSAAGGRSSGALGLFSVLCADSVPMPS